MGTVLKIRLIWILVLLSYLFIACKKKTTYDLFPLKVGNEFHYLYHKYSFSGVSSGVNGTVTWKVVSESAQGGSINYTIEIKMDATVTGIGAGIISDSIRYVTISEDKSSSSISASSLIYFWNFPFKRYQDFSHIEVIQECHTSLQGWRFYFKADSGLTKYTYCHPPNHIVQESLILDSLKISQEN